MTPPQRTSPLDRFLSDLFGEPVLSDIDERQRDVLVRSYVDGQSLEDIGDAYGVSRERIRQLRFKALASLRWRVKELS